MELPGSRDGSRKLASVPRPGAGFDPTAGEEVRQICDLDADEPTNLVVGNATVLDRVAHPAQLHIEEVGRLLQSK